MDTMSKNKKCSNCKKYRSLTFFINEKKRNLKTCKICRDKSKKYYRNKNMMEMLKQQEIKEQEKEADASDENFSNEAILSRILNNDDKCVICGRNDWSCRCGCPTSPINSDYWMWGDTWF